MNTYMSDEQKWPYSALVRLTVGLLFLFLLPFSLKADTKTTGGDYVLFLNSVSFSESWTNRVYSSIESSLEGKVTVKADELYVPTITDMQQAEERREALLQKYPQPPRLVVFFGDPGWLLCRPLFEGPWKGVPVLLCYSMKRIPRTFEDLLAGDWSPGHTELSDSLPAKYDMTVLRQPFYIKQTLSLMKGLLPDMRKIVFISDSRYVSRQARREVKDVMRTDFPDLQLDSLISPALSTQNLLDSLDSYRSENVGVIYYSWFVDSGAANAGGFLDDKVQKIVDSFSETPVFTLSDADTESGDFAGGYFISATEFSRTATEVIQRILAGTPARSIPVGDGGTPGANLNYRHLVGHHIDPSALPSNARYFQKPLSFVERNKPLLVSLVCIVFLIITLIITYLRYSSQRRNQRKRELELLGGYKRLVNNMPIVYVQGRLISDGHDGYCDYELLDVNPAFEKMFGIDRQTAIGRRFSELFQEYPFYQIMQEHIGRNMSLEMTDASGDKRYFDKLVMDSRENIFDVFYVDKTETRQAYARIEELNEMYELLLKAARMTIWGWDLQARKVECDVEYSLDISDPAKRHLVFTEEEYFARIHPDDVAVVREGLRRLAANETVALNVSFRITFTTDQSRYHYIESYASVARRDEKGNPTMLVGASMDITRRKELENDLVEAKTKAEESNRLKSAFLANMSHEIRTPLNAIVGFSGILTQTDDEQEKQEYASIIENNNQLLLQLIGDILDLSKIEAGVLEFSSAGVELHPLLSEVAQAGRLKLQSNQVEILLDEPLDPICIQTDRNRVMQVITNFVNNALKFTESGSVRLGYRLREDGMVYVYVSDTGCGIPPDKQRSVFARFVKLNTFKQGSGLGLSICESIIDRLGGKIGVDSTEGQGSTFWFTLPYRPTEMPQPELPEKVIVPKPVEKEERIKILVAEDNASNYKLFESVLKKDYDLIHAWNGQEAVEMFKEHAPQLILMDIKMPVLDGYQATAEIRKLSQEVPIIAVTAYAFEGDEVNIMNSGFDGYASKPIQAQGLRDKIISLLKKRLIFV